eukprot:Hpha_TRINITY_DN15916_c4_g3::TRINITY_DN15916_c4_g3_i2::g.72766::m.72766
MFSTSYFLRRDAPPIVVTVDASTLNNSLSTIFGELVRYRQLFERVQQGIQQLGVEVEERRGESRQLVAQCEHRLKQRISAESERRDQEHKRLEDLVLMKDASYNAMHAALGQRIDTTAMQADEAIVLVKKELDETIAELDKRVSHERVEAAGLLDTTLDERFTSVTRDADA